MLKKILKLLFYKRKVEYCDKYLDCEINLRMGVPYKGRKYKVTLSVAPLSFCNDGYCSYLDRFKSYGKEYSYVEDFEILSIKGESISHAMEKELAIEIYTTSDLFDIVCDGIMDYIHEEKAEEKFCKEE